MEELKRKKALKTKNFLNSDDDEDVPETDNHGEQSDPRSKDDNK